jgi:hypothetical protein
LSSATTSIPLKTHVASACFKFFRCFIDMLHVFHADDAIDCDVAYVAIIIHVYCKLLFPMFHLFFFICMLQVCLFGCCICMFHTYVTSVLSAAHVLQ